MPTPQNPSRRTILAGLAAASTAALIRPARAASQTIRIGHLTDIAGPYSTNSGPASIACAHQAIEDFNPVSKNLIVDYMVADHQNNADVALNIAREWLDRGDVDAILEVNNSAIALAMSNLTQQKDKVHLNSGAVSADLTGKACSPNMVHWTYDSWMLAHAPSIALTRSGFKTWYMIAPDYAFGASLTRDCTKFIEAEGGKMLGVSKHPFPGVTDFSSYLLAAQGSGAQVIALANGGSDIVNCIKQAHEFGLPQRGIKMVALAAQTTDIHGLGLEAAQGLINSQPFYWDLNERTRAFTQRVLPKTPTNRPSVTHAGAYSALLHYLKACASLGTEKAKASGRAVVDEMKRLPTDDDCFGAGFVREDGRKIHPTYLLEAKKPADSHYAWDYQKVMDTIPADQSFRPLNEGGCPFVKV